MTDGGNLEENWSNELKEEKIELQLLSFIN